MIPLRDVIPSRTTPYITVTIIALNIVAWFYELSLDRDILPVFLQANGVVPAYFNPWTLITSMFLHGSWMHVIGNMWYLWIFGDNVEDRVGHGRFIVFYLLCGMTAALGQIIMEPTSLLPTIGASGAIAGVMGAYFVLYPRSRVLTLIPWIFEENFVPSDQGAGHLWNAGNEAMRWQDNQTGIAHADEHHQHKVRRGLAVTHVAGFLLGVVGVFVFRKRQRDPWAGYY